MLIFARSRSTSRPSRINSLTESRGIAGNRGCAARASGSWRSDTPLGRAFMKSRRSGSSCGTGGASSIGTPITTSPSTRSVAARRRLTSPPIETPTRKTRSCSWRRARKASRARPVQASRSLSARSSTVPLWPAIQMPLARMPRVTRASATGRTSYGVPVSPCRQSAAAPVAASAAGRRSKGSTSTSASTWEGPSVTRRVPAAPAPAPARRPPVAADRVCAPVACSRRTPASTRSRLRGCESA